MGGVCVAGAGARAGGGVEFEVKKAPYGVTVAWAMCGGMAVGGWGTGRFAVASCAATPSIVLVLALVLAEYGTSVFCSSQSIPLSSKLIYISKERTCKISISTTPILAMSGTSAYAMGGCELRIARAWSGVVFWSWTSSSRSWSSGRVADAIEYCFFEKMEGG